jgi:hypothetical protein
LQIALEIELLGERIGGGGRQRPLGQRQRVGGRGGQPGSDCCNLGFELVVVGRTSR